MIITLLAPSAPIPMGGVLGIFEFANGLARLGHDVHMGHVELAGTRVTSLEELRWAPFDDRVTHHFVREPAEIDVPGCDVVLAFDDRIPDHLGEPAMFVQAFRILDPETEREIYRSPVPKLCTSSWLRRVAIHLGNPPAQTFLVPYGIRHEKYRLVRPLADRPRRVCMLMNGHPLKRADVGIDALHQIRRADPSVDVVTFGVHGWPSWLPAGLPFVLDPPQSTLVEEIYNASSIFVSPAMMEGFGLAALEAMACGCALVTTDNGGSWDYADDDVTAAVVPLDPDAMAARVAALLADDRTRLRLAEAGVATARRFSWDAGARALERVLIDYLDDPEAMRRPVDDRYRNARIDAVHDVLATADAEPAT